jgi:predicted O-methyltransferase YrrM
MSPKELQEIVYGFRTSRIVLTSMELKLYDALEDGEQSSNEISKKLSTNEKAIDRLMNALCALELLQKKNGKFSNSEFSSRYLVKGKPDYISNLFHSTDLWRSWSNLTEIIYEGKPKGKFYEKRKEEHVDHFISAMHYRASRQAKEDISKLNLKNVKNVLDLGGGSGAYAIEFVKVKKQITAIVFDLPDVIPLTQKYISDAGLSDKIKTLKGNYLTDSIGAGYDLIFLSAIVHSNSFEENKKLIQKCADALNKNGQVVIQDYVLDEERISPYSGTLFAINMLVNTQEGDAYTQKEISSWLTDAGLSDLSRNDTSHGASQIIGREKIQS